MKNEIKKISSILLYSDKRVDLKKASYEKAIELFKENNLEYVKEDIIYFKNIKIDDTREILKKSSQTSYNGLKIFILNFDNITYEATNALLKIIEEPPKMTCFIILTTNIDNMLDTILSRCIKIYVKAKEIEVDNRIYNLLEGNISYIEEFLENSIDIKEYKIENLEEAFFNIEKYIKNKENSGVYIYLNYQLSMEYIVNEAKFLEEKLKLNFIINIIKILENSKDETLNFLNRLTILSAFKLKKRKYEFLVNLKNTIKNNVNKKIVLYIYLIILLEEV